MGVVHRNTCENPWAVLDQPAVHMNTILHVNPSPFFHPPPLHCIRLAVQGQEPDAKAKARFERSLEAAKTLQPLEDALSTGENSSGAAHKPR